MDKQCIHCGGGEGIHHFLTNQCPVGGREAPIGRAQVFKSTTFKPVVDVPEDYADPNNFTLQKIGALADTYQDALFMEADLQKAYLDAQSLTQYRRDDVVRRAYYTGTIDGSNDRQRKLQENHIISEDLATAYLEGYEDKALKALTLATVERKRIEAEIGLIKAWLYSQSGVGR